MIYKFDPFKFFKTFNIKIDTVLDIGARKGDWTKEFLEHFPESKSLMIEANGDHVEELKKVGPYVLALVGKDNTETDYYVCCLLYTSPSPRDRQKSRMPSSA